MTLELRGFLSVIRFFSLEPLAHFLLKAPTCT
jgi:hypothetical protein